MTVGGLALVAVLGLVWRASTTSTGLSSDGGTTVAVFAVAVWAWVFTRVNDTYVALGAATALVLSDAVETSVLFDSLGDETVWLLLAAFVIAAAVGSTGLATRAAAWVVTAARTPRQLVHLTTVALVVTAFAVPSTSGRAALTMPVFLALAAVLHDQERLVRALALLFPTVILLSAVASMLGAGAHLVTSQVVASATGNGFSFVEWMLLGLPLALASSHVAAELVLGLMTGREDRRRRLRVEMVDVAAHSETPVVGPLTVQEGRAIAVLVVVVVLWCTEPLHGIHPAITALVGALVITSPRYGSISLSGALAKAPWSLLLFMAATLALAEALVTTGAARWLAGGVVRFLPTGGGAALVFVVGVVLVSVAAHLVVQSRSARSAVLVPIVVALAPGIGVDPAAAAFASTAAAGFCHTMPSSAKPVALFADLDGVPGYAPRDLLRLSVLLAPAIAALVLLAAHTIWPVLGLPLYVP
ncbi:MAG: SLC13 family permease [Dermatophilaceae bacterium]